MIEHERWTLRVSFATLEEQASVDPESIFPYDYVSSTVAFIGQHWGGLPEELEEFCEWDGTTVTVTSPVIEAMGDLMSWLTMHTIPKKIELVRNEEL